MTPIILPQFDVNSSDAALVEWLAGDGDAVRAGQVLCVVETTKSVHELHAEGDGVLVRIAAKGGTVQFHQIVGYLAADAAEAARLREQPAAPEAPAPDTGVKATKRAAEIARQHGIALTDMRKDGIITEADVLACIAAAKPASRIIPAYQAPEGLTRVLVIPGGYGATQVMDILLNDPRVRIAGCLDDDPELQGRTILGLPVLGKMERIEDLWRERKFDAAIVGLGTSPQLRKKFFARCVELGIPMVNAIDPSVRLNRGVVLGSGNVICSQVHLGVCTVIGDNNFFSARASLDHHNVWGSHNTLGPNVVTSALVEVGDENKFGMGISIQPRIRIGSGCLVASGAVLIQPVPDRHVVRVRLITEIEPLPN
jgi:sugar O-acyltransferase (sialic acid O-acetyltransferase NeuD family)